MILLYIDLSFIISDLYKHLQFQNAYMYCIDIYQHFNKIYCGHQGLFGNINPIFHMKLKTVKMAKMAKIGDVDMLHS